MTNITAYILMAVSIAFSVTNSCILHKFSNKGIETKGDLFLFNAGISCVWTVVMLSLFFIFGGTKISPIAIIFGLIYGILLCLFLYYKTVSMSEGPVSLTTLIGSCAFVIATGFSVIYAHESISVFQIIGMIILLVSLILCVNPKMSGEKLTVKWFLYSFAFFLAGGFVGIFYKFFGRSAAASEVTGMMLIASASSAVIFTVFGYIINLTSGNPLPKIRKCTVFYIILSGLASCIYIRLNVTLSNIIPGTVFFPVSNGSMVILSSAAGKLFFKEKLKPIQIAGIFTGIIALIITGCGQAVFKFIFRG